MAASSGKAISFLADGLRLCGHLHMPQMVPLAIVVGCHGLLSDKSSPKQIALAERCIQMRIAYFRFDHRGCGQSEGDFNADTTIDNRRSDLLSAVGAAKHAAGNTIPVGLFGSSLGGSICLAAAQALDPFALVTLASPVQSRSIRIPEESPESLKQEIIRNRLDFNLGRQIQSLHRILIVHGDCDETVPVENAQMIFSRAGEPKRKVILKGGDHRISRPDHQMRFIDEASRWFAMCLRDILPNGL